MIVGVVQEVRPSVVNIDTEARVLAPFGVFPAQGAGSAVIVRPEGYILTNDHVVRGATATVITGRRWGGGITARDRCRSCWRSRRAPDGTSLS